MGHSKKCYSFHNWPASIYGIIIGSLYHAKEFTKITEFYLAHQDRFLFTDVIDMTMVMWSFYYLGSFSYYFFYLFGFFFIPNPVRTIRGSRETFRINFRFFSKFRSRQDDFRSWISH